MEYDDAVNVILMHGIGRDDQPTGSASLEQGFLRCLRPFTELREENYLQIMEAIIALHPHLAGKRQVDRRLVAGLWYLTRMSRLWGLDPDGMLQRNHLLSDEETKQLQRWVRDIEYAVQILLSDRSPAKVLAMYLDPEVDGDAFPT